MFWHTTGFSSKENMEFIIALESNRGAASSYEAKLSEDSHRIDTLELPEGEAARVRLRGLDFPVLIQRRTCWVACEDGADAERPLLHIHLLGLSAGIAQRETLNESLRAWNPHIALRHAFDELQLLKTA